MPRPKSRYRAHAEHTATFGRWPGVRLNYEVWFGEYLNRDRSQAVAAVQHYYGQVACMTGRPHRDMADAMVSDPARVPALLRQFESARAEAEARARQPPGL